MFHFKLKTMKKILSFVVVLASVAMVSCGGNANKKAAVEAEVEAAAVENCCEQSEECPCEQAEEVEAPATEEAAAEVEAPVEAQAE